VTEEEYIAVTDLDKIRTALKILQNVSDQDLEMGCAVGILSEKRKKLNNKVRALMD